MRQFDQNSQEQITKLVESIADFNFQLTVDIETVNLISKIDDKGKNTLLYRIMVSYHHLYRSLCQITDLLDIHPNRETLTRELNYGLREASQKRGNRKEISLDLLYQRYNPDNINEELTSISEKLKIPPQKFNPRKIEQLEQLPNPQQQP